MELLKQNSKIKKASKHFGVRVFNWSIPAYKTSKGKLTCPMADSCIKFCYAQKGAFIWSNVKSVHERNYELSKTNDFIGLMNENIKRKRPDFIRVHDAGDYYSRSYMLKWFRIAKDNPAVRFYSYTNMVGMVKELRMSELIPPNYDFIFSDSGKQINLIDKSTDRHTRIFSTKGSLKKNKYVDASEYDLLATKWFSKNHRVGLIFH